MHISRHTIKRPHDCRFCFFAKSILLHRFDCPSCQMAQWCALQLERTLTKFRLSAEYLHHYPNNSVHWKCRNGHDRCMGKDKRLSPKLNPENSSEVEEEHELPDSRPNQLNHHGYSISKYFQFIQKKVNFWVIVAEFQLTKTSFLTFGIFSMTPNSNTVFNPFSTNGSKCFTTWLMPNRETPGMLGISSIASSFSLEWNEYKGFI